MQGGSNVMAALVAAIHDSLQAAKTWMRGTSPHDDEGMKASRIPDSGYQRIFCALRQPIAVHGVCRWALSDSRDA
jgi:hypothetical protein